MLSLTVLGQEATVELPDGSIEFVTFGGYNLELEHSLVALSKWESKFKKPFLDESAKSPEEILYYIRSMALHPNVPEEVFQGLENSHLQQINEYMNDPMTATWFNERPQPPNPGGEKITNELLYFWISQFGLHTPTVELWHLKRLFTVLKVANHKSQPPKKKPRSEVIADMRRMNDERRRLYEPNA